MRFSLRQAPFSSGASADAPVPAGVVPRYTNRDVSQWVVHRCFKLLVLLTFPSRVDNLRATPGGPSAMSVRIIDSKAALTGLSMIFV